MKNFYRIQYRSLDEVKEHLDKIAEEDREVFFRASLLCTPLGCLYVFEE